MKYMLLVYSPENAWNRDEWTKCTVESMAVCQELAAKGEFITASPLHPVNSAISVRVRDGKRLITDGPFAETTEQLGGFYLIDVANLDEAISIAGRIPPASKGTIEIRPVRQLDSLPPDRLAERGAFPISQGNEFMFLCYDDEQYWSNAGPDAHQAAMEEASAVTRELAGNNQYICAAPLLPTSTATSVRVRDGKRIVTDGPFAETREVLGGFYLILAKGIDEAVSIASRHSGARVGSVEVRPVYQLKHSEPLPELLIVSQRDFDFDRETVFEAYSNPEKLARWWGPAGFRNTFNQFQFKLGGAWIFVMHGPDGKNYDNQSVFETIEAPEKIVLNHVCPPYFQMTITLNELPGKKTRIVWQISFESEQVRDALARYIIPANEENFDRLTAELKSNQHSKS